MRTHAVSRVLIKPSHEECGFKSFRSGEYTVAEQFWTFSDADVAIGVHGAGLTNLRFRTDGHALNCLAATLPLSSIHSPYKPTMSITCGGFVPRGSDLLVDPNRLRELLNLGGIDPVDC